MIGYYVHHHGSGHLARMQEVARHLRSPVTGLSSLPAPCGVPWLQLASDAEGRTAVDETAGGRLHWVPRHDPGLRHRAAQILDWVDRNQPDLMVVDVSVEVAVLVRLAGTPVVVMAMPGRRDDAAHVLGLDLADALVAAWPQPSSPESWPRRWWEKTHFVGAFSRFDDMICSTPAPRSSAADNDRQVLLLWGTGGTGPSQEQMTAAAAATPGWSWDVADGSVPSDQVWSRLRSTDVVVTHGGQSAVAEVAAARVPAIVIADVRPFDEQEMTVAQLRTERLAVGAESWPAPHEWTRLLDEALALGGEGWARWSDGEGGRRTATLLDDLAHELRGRPLTAASLTNR